MDNFDNLWDTVDIDAIDIPARVDDEKNNSAIKKTDRILTKQQRAQNLDMDYDNFLDYDNPEGDQLADQGTRWRKIILHCEQNFKKLWAKKSDEFNYEMNKFKQMPDTSKNNKKLNELNQKRQDLLDWAKDKIIDIDYSKGRASGFITNDKTVFYTEHPEAVRAKLATGQYEYTPTTLK